MLIPSEERQREKRRVARCSGEANSASSLPVFTGGLGTRNGSGYKRHQAPTAAPAAPGRGDGWGDGAHALAPRQGRGVSRPRPRGGVGGERGAPYRPGLLRPVRGVPDRWTRCVQKHTQTPRAHSLRKERLPRKSWSGSSISLKCFLPVTNRAPRHSNQDTRRKARGPRAHARAPRPQGRSAPCTCTGTAPMWTGQPVQQTLSQRRCFHKRRKAILCRPSQTSPCLLGGHF